jgi:trimeric autotransporter adhesin
MCRNRPHFYWPALKLALLFSGFLLMPVSPAHGQTNGSSDDVFWQPGHGMPGVDNNIFALTTDAAGNLLAGGQFTVAGEAFAHRVARWNGSTWSALGTGLNNTVHALAVGPDGSVYAGGIFTEAGGAAANRVARWDGATWSPLGAGTNGAVHALAVGADGSIYAAGAFTVAGEQSANRIARWDGSAWSPLGSGMSGTVRSLAIDDAGILYAGGDFSVAGGTEAARIARWDGSAWSTLGSGMNNSVHAVAVGEEGIFASGDFTTAGGISAARVAHWDGAAWSALGSGMNGSVRSLARDDNLLYAGGVFLSAGGQSAIRIAVWNGSSWAPMASGLVNQAVDALTVTPDGALYAGGGFMAAGGLGVSRIARWQGGAWSPVGSGFNNPVLAFALAEDSTLYAAGAFTSAGTASANRIARWDGSAWNALGSGMNNNVNAIAVGPDGLVYAGGTFGNAGGNQALRVAQWDGSSWAPMGPGVNNHVWALAVGPDGELYAGGQFTNPSGRVARWDGSAWSPLGGGVNGTVRALAVAPDGSVYVGGLFTMAGGMNIPYLARWDGSGWEGVGSALNGAVYSLSFGADGALYAGGSFTVAGGVSASGIARWDGTTWSGLGSGTNGNVFAIAQDAAGRVYAGGEFTTAGGLQARGAARWNGAEWQSLGSGTSHPVRALVTLADTLYAGGDFTAAGNRVSAFTGTWVNVDSEPDDRWTLVEDFEAGQKSEYDPATVELATGAWLLADAVLGDHADDRKQGARSVRLRSTGAVAEMLFDKEYGAGTVALLHGAYRADGDQGRFGEWQLEVSRNMGRNWDPVGSPVAVTNELQEVVFEIGHLGPVRFRVVKTGGNGGNHRINIDEFRVTDATAGRAVANVTGRAGWRMMSSPVQNATYDDLVGGIVNGGGKTGHSVMVYSESTQAFEPVADLGTRVDAGAGFLVRVPDSGDALYTIAVTGAENTSVRGRPLRFATSATLEQAGWNLLGNPFASAIAVGALGLGDNPHISNVVYAWDPDAGESGEFVEIHTLDNPSVRIEPFQGFLVKANASDQVIDILSAAHAAKAVFDHMPVAPRLGLTLSSGGLTREAIVTFRPDGSLGIDANDGFLRAPLAESFMRVYTATENGKRLVFNNLPAQLQEEVEIPLGVQTSFAGEFTLSWTLPDDFAGDWQFTLVDASDGAAIDMRARNAFTFDGAATPDGEERLVLRIEPAMTGGEEIPVTVTLYPNFPNPFNPSTTIRYYLPEAAPVRLTVFDMAGRRLAVLVDGTLSEGEHRAVWDASNLASGVYVYRLEAGGHMVHGKMTLVK